MKRCGVCRGALRGKATMVYVAHEPGKHWHALTNAIIDRDDDVRALQELQRLARELSCGVIAQLQIDRVRILDACDRQLARLRRHDRLQLASPDAPELPPTRRDG